MILSLSSIHEVLNGISFHGLESNGLVVPALDDEGALREGEQRRLRLMETLLHHVLPIRMDKVLSACFLAADTR
jgi:hypothetical protein